ncbi:MAG: cadherin-like beta sandwich domain-containing protein [Clostridiales bacterium]|nr:cadherin-like beta sandwich domain-containing protein [Clostridiales bacterium]
MMKRFGIRFFMTAAFLFVLSFQSFAASGRIAFSDPSAQVGEEVSVTVKFSTTGGEALGNTDIMLSYDPEILEYINETENASGGAGAIRVWSAPTGASEATTILRFQALKAGTATISVTSWEAYDNNGQSLETVKEGSSAVTVSALATSSTDATLASMTISPGSLTPSFTPLTESYAVTVGLDTTQLTVSAVANNDKATVALEGGDDLQEGENTVICRVTAEDGTTVKEYTITVTRVEGGETAASEEGETGSETPEVLAELTVTARKIQIIDLPEGVEVPAGFRESSIAIGDTKVPGWTWAADESPRYCVFYGMNDNGEQNFYRYDLTEKTIQRYFEEDNAGVTSEEYETLADNYNSLVGDYQKVKILMFVFIGIAVILLVVLLISRRGAGRGENDRYQKYDREPAKSPERTSVSRSAGGRKLSKEERYMRGEEEEYEEEDADVDRETLEASPAATSAQTAAAAEDEEGGDDDFEFFDL